MQSNLLPHKGAKIWRSALWLGRKISLQTLCARRTLLHFLSSSLSFCRTMPFSFPCGQEVALRGAKTGFILRGVYLTVESVCWSTNIDDNWANVSSANASARPLLRIYHCTLLNMPMNSRSWRPRDGPITALCVRRPENNEVRSGIRLNQKRSI